MAVESTEDPNTSLEKAGTSLPASPGQGAEAPKRAWRGDEHRLQVAAAKEAGLDEADAELDLYTEGFRAGMVLEDSYDKSIVLKGRTVLAEKQLQKSLKPMLRFLKLAPDQVALQLHDGAFELRVSREAAEQAAPALDSAKVALKFWLGAGLIGLLAYQLLPVAAALVWGVGLVVGGLTLRSGLVNGRSMLAARLTVGLGMLAKEEQLILPPVKPDGS